MSEYWMPTEEIDKRFSRVSFASQKLRFLDVIVFTS
tara:strand:+ start:479 stop:586 length:108 start_codon:yes stop_codon:yes gene_type:complete